MAEKEERSSVTDIQVNISILAIRKRGIRAKRKDVEGFFIKLKRLHRLPNHLTFLSRSIDMRTHRELSTPEVALIRICKFQKCLFI